MKRLLSLTLAVLMVLSLSAAAFAEGKTETWDKMGFTLTYPEEFNNTKGIFLPYPYPTEKDGIYTMMFNYYAFSKEDSDAFNEKTKNGGLSEEDTARILDAQGTLLFVMGIDGGRGAQELLETLGLKDAGPEALTEVGKHDDITYFALMAPELYSDYVEKIPAEYAEEYRSLQTAMVEVLKQAEYFTPRNGAGDLMGSILQFETVDLDGNVVKSEELFAAHAITMVNIWATWCGPCKSEMPELGELARALEADGRDAAIVGICSDADEEPEFCGELLTELNATYLNLLPYEGMLEKLDISSLPTTLFVDREGKILLPPIKGVPEDLSQYEKLIDAFLAAAA